MSQTVKQPDRRTMPNVREEMTASMGSPLATLGDPLIRIQPEHLDATARWPSIAHMATLRTLSKQASTEKIKTVSGVMDFWETSYGRISIGYKGKAREEYGRFANLAAAGGGTIAGNDAALQELLNEGSRTADKGKSGRWPWSRNK